MHSAITGHRQTPTGTVAQTHPLGRASPHGRSGRQTRGRSLQEKQLRKVCCNKLVKPVEPSIVAIDGLDRIKVNIQNTSISALFPINTKPLRFDLRESISIHRLVR